MSSIGEGTELKTKFVKYALQGMFAVQPPFPIPEWSEADVNKELLAAGTHLERIQIVKPYFSPEKFRTFLLKATVLEKDDSTAEMFMKKCDEYYSSSDNKMALRSLNLAMIFATNKNIGVIYRLRSALLFELENWEACLQDTELGLQINCPKPVMDELRDRQLKCENLIGTRENADSPDVVAKREFRDSVLLQLYKGRNDKIPSASSVVEIRCDEKRGRGLFVTEDIDPGTTLLIENPYVTNLTEGLNWATKRCWRCWKKILRITPCGCCVFAVYCGEECRSEDVGHAYECQCLAYFHGAFLGPNVLLGYKTMLKSGPEALLKLDKTSTLEEIQKTNGIDPKTGVYDSASYLTTLSFASHIKNNGKLPHLVWRAILFTEILDVKTNYFAQVEESEKEGFKDFVASLALFHGLSIPYNCVGLEEAVDETESIGLNNITPEKKYVCFALANYPLISLLNHGCDANVTRVNLTNGKMVIISLRGLKSGEEMLLNYGYDYATTTLKDRQEFLLQVYLFSCNCVACKFDWPLQKVLAERADDTKLCCPECADKFGYEHSSECALTEDFKEGNGTCPSCSKKFALMPLYLELDAGHSALTLSTFILSSESPVPGIPLLLDYIKLLQRSVCQPSSEFCATQRHLDTAYSKVMED